MSLAFNGNKNFYKSSIHLKNINFKYDNNNILRILMNYKVQNLINSSQKKTII